jgi:hypothetical protein
MQKTDSRTQRAQHRHHRTGMQRAKSRELRGEKYSRVQRLVCCVLLKRPPVFRALVLWFHLVLGVDVTLHAACYIQMHRWGGRDGVGGGGFFVRERKEIVWTE